MLLLLLWLFAWVSASSLNLGLENRSVRRTIDIRTHIEEVTHFIDVVNNGDEEVSSYIFAVHPSKVPHLSYVEAKQDKAKLTVTEISGNDLNAPEGSSLFMFSLKKPIRARSSSSLTVLAVFSHSLTPTPSEITQFDNQLVVFKDSSLFFSPYKSSTQRTTIKLASANVQSYTKKSGSHRGEEIEYGQFENVAAFSWSEIIVHYENNSPFITFKDYVKEIEISHWGNIAVREHYLVANTGAKLVGPFSRFDYQRLGNSGAGSFRSLSALLPGSASDLYYTDRIGNVSTSHVRDQGRYQHIELEPRFPMFGGWQTDFVLGYNVPASEHLRVSKDNPHHFVLNISFSTPFLQAVVDNAVVKVVLPEGASNIEFATPFAVDMREETLKTYLDTTGRPVVVLTKQNLVKHHNQHFQVSYTYSSAALTRKPVSLVVLFFLFFAACMFFVRLNFSIQPTKQD